MTNIILCGGNGTRLWPIYGTLVLKHLIKLTKKSQNNFDKGIIENNALRFSKDRFEQEFELKINQLYKEFKK